MSWHVLKLDLNSARWMPKLVIINAQSYAALTSQSLRATIGPLQDNWPLHYVIGISGILPYNRNVTLQTLELFSVYARLYNAAASPTSRLRSAGSLAMSSDTLFVCACVLLVKKSTNACKAELTSWSQGMTARKIFTNKTLAPGV